MLVNKCSGTAQLTLQLLDQRIVIASDDIPFLEQVAGWFESTPDDLEATEVASELQVEVSKIGATSKTQPMRDVRTTPAGAGPETWAG